MILANALFDLYHPYPYWIIYLIYSIKKIHLYLRANKVIGARSLKAPNLNVNMLFPFEVVP